MDTDATMKSALLVLASVGVGLYIAQLAGARPSKSDRYDRSPKSHRRRRRRGKHADSSEDESDEPADPKSRSSSPQGRSWQGFSLTEAKFEADARNAAATALSPAVVLDELQRGNARFWMNASSRPQSNALHRRSLLNGQYPTVAVLGCSDSRVPVEIVFDQGLGDIFVIRVAGNILEETTQASIEYAVAHLRVKVVVVLGHEGCGAVKAAQQPVENFDGEPDALKTMLKQIKSGLDEKRLEHIHDGRARDREAVVTNVRHQLVNLEKDTLIKAKVAAGELVVTGAFYEISSGIVDFFDNK